MLHNITLAYIYICMKPARGLQTEFISNYCSGTTGLAKTIKCQAKCAKICLWALLGTVTAVTRGTVVTGQLGLGTWA